ncbi:hypothetical protein LJC33_01830 [Eubacteriales bacterium OttesenSCG-928-N13]|nr:hypothetical protein [Eubacteriales bacterium OttesenSCG-928-N13]
MNQESLTTNDLKSQLVDLKLRLAFSEMHDEEISSFEADYENDAKLADEIDTAYNRNQAKIFGRIDTELRRQRFHRLVRNTRENCFLPLCPRWRRRKAARLAKT